MKIFRVTVEVGNLDQATAFYTKLLDLPGKPYAGARMYFDCGGVLLAVVDTVAAGKAPTPCTKSVYFAVDDIHAVHARATALGALSQFEWFGQSSADVVKRIWGETSFYVTDPWDNTLNFIDSGWLYGVDPESSKPA